MGTSHLLSDQMMTSTSAMGSKNVKYACYNGNDSKVLRKTDEWTWVVDKCICWFSASWMKHMYDFGFLSSFWPIIFLFTYVFISVHIERSLFSCNLWHYMALWLKGSKRENLEWHITSHRCHRLKRGKIDFLLLFVYNIIKINTKKPHVMTFKTIVKVFFSSFGWTYAVCYRKANHFHVSWKCFCCCCCCFFPDTLYLNFCKNNYKY